jgi:hypothetical protein
MRLPRRCVYPSARLSIKSALSTPNSPPGAHARRSHPPYPSTRVYERFFRSIRNDALVIAEMGLLRSDADGRKASWKTTAVAYTAPSLQMWRAYFPHADIFGFDIDDFSAVKIDNCNILRGDMSSKADLLRLAHAIGRPIDIIIDDASHASHHQQIALGTLFPFVRDGGLGKMIYLRFIMLRRQEIFCAACRWIIGLRVHF